MYNGDCISINQIKPGLKNINVIFIVLDIGAATVTKENREVRNFKVGDHSGCINVSIWDEPGKLIAPGDIIKLTKGYASIWRHCLTLYSGKNGEVFKIGEFCMTFNEQINMSEPKRPEQPQQSALNIAAVNQTQQILPGNGNGNPTQRLVPQTIGGGGGATSPSNPNVTTINTQPTATKTANIQQTTGAAAQKTQLLNSGATGTNAGTTNQQPASGVKSNRGRASNTRAASNLKADRR